MLAGQRLGPYEILAKLGEGGMGEVYRARDMKLNRDVALKTLPASLAADPDYLARFKRESQLLASLNHANIAAVFGFEDADVRIDYPVWSPDGRRVLFDRAAPHGGDLWLLDGIE